MLIDELNSSDTGKMYPMGVNGGRKLTFLPHTLLHWLNIY